MALREGGDGETVSITAAEHGNQVILEFYRAAARNGEEAEGIAALDPDDQRRPASVFRWRMLSVEAEEFHQNLRTVVKEDVYDRRRTQVNFVLARDVTVVLVLNRTDIDNLITAMGEALHVSRPQAA